MRLYEAHLPVADTDGCATILCRNRRVAIRTSRRDIVFLWAGGDKKSMLGLWGPSTTLGHEFHKCHIAFNVSFPELLAAGKRLNEAGIQTRNFTDKKTTEPSVIGWMPSAQL